MEEQWKDVPGFEGYYQASDQGRFKSLARTLPKPNGGFENKPEQILNQCESQGYLHIVFHVDGERTERLSHRVIAEMFVHNPDNKPEVNHKKGNKKDNRAIMLEWSTSSENKFHAYQTGLRIPQSGFDHHKAKIVMNIENGIFYGSAIEAAKAHSIKIPTLQAILCGRNPNNTNLIYV